ncbi:unnamed protein product [Orchesella dallaii]|uniref:C2H2-type domain-containing protein n=1 Tax=Orchesella dallaii TaxID=48710 RepID=A0ABP1Q1A6_9HEXA
MELERSFETNGIGEDAEADEVKIEYSEELNWMADDTDPLDVNYAANNPPHHTDIPFSGESEENLLKRKKGKSKSKASPTSIDNDNLILATRKRRKLGAEEEKPSPPSKIDPGTRKKSDRKYISPPPQSSSKSKKLREPQPQQLATTFPTSSAKPKAVMQTTLEKQDDLTLEIKPFKTTNPLQVLPNPGNNTEHHCLICYKTFIDTKSGTSQKITGDNGLRGNMNILVILRRLLDVPSEDVKKCLQYCGNPSNWFKVCTECQPLIQHALSVNDKLVEVLKQLNNCKDLIVEQIKESVLKSNEALKNSGKCQTCSIKSCRGHMKYLTDKIRKFVSKKIYPETTNPYEEGDQKAEAEVKARIAAVSISDSFIESVRNPVEDISGWSDDDDKDINTDDDDYELPPNRSPLLPSTDIFAPIENAEPDSSLLLQSSTFQVSKKTYHCSVCPNLTTPDGMSLNQFLCHFTFHIRRPFQCSECKLFFPMNETVKEQHWKTYHEDTTPTPSEERFQIVLLGPVSVWGCMFCDETFSTESDREDHLENKHELQHKQISKQYVCFHCPRKFYNKNDRRIHIVVDQCSNANILNCPACEKSFKCTTAAGTEYLDEPALYEHIDKSHPDQISSFKLKACEFCGLVFVGVPNQFPGLVSHKRTTHGYATAFSCHICDVDFASRSQLDQHLSSIYSEDTQRPSLMVSKTVKKSGKEVLTLQTHVKLRSMSKKPIERTHEPVSLPSTSTMSKNSVKPQTKSISKMTKEPLYSCASCPHLSPKTLYNFLQHIALHKKRPNRCVECSVYLPKDEEVIRDHWTKFHKGSDKVPHCTEVAFSFKNIWNCPKCPESFCSIEEQFQHEQRAHGSRVVYGKGNHTCLTCSKKLYSFQEWQLHRAVEHPQVAEMSCFYCDETFILKTIEEIDLCDSVRRRRHVKDKHPKEQIKLSDPCQLCGMDFTSVAGLDSHLKDVHSIADAKLYQCRCPIPLCNYAGTTTSRLRSHIELMHLPSEDHVCDNCGWSSKHIQQLRHHQYKIHNIVADGFPVLTCEFEGCTFQAVRKGDITKHSRVHLPEEKRPYKCDVCGKGFYTSKHFRDHLESHANKDSKPYQCELCGTSFAVKNYLYVHTRLRHQRRLFPSTYRAKYKGNNSKGLSKTKKRSKATATGSDLVSPEKNMGLSDELVTTSMVAATTSNNVSLPGSSKLPSPGISFVSYL